MEIALIKLLKVIIPLIIGLVSGHAINDKITRKKPIETPKASVETSSLLDVTGTTDTKGVKKLQKPSDNALSKKTTQQGAQ